MIHTTDLNDDTHNILHGLMGERPLYRNLTDREVEYFAELFMDVEKSIENIKNGYIRNAYMNKWNEIMDECVFDVRGVDELEA